MNMAIDIALTLQQEYTQFYKMGVKTSTVKLVDDLIPLDESSHEECSTTSQIRYNSAIEITFTYSITRAAQKIDSLRS